MKGGFASVLNRQILGLFNDIIERGSLALIVFDALGFFDIQKYTVVMNGEEETIGQLHALNSCVKLTVKWRRVWGLINQIGHVCLAFIKRIPQGLW